jgi:hypothetical protein
MKSSLLYSRTIYGNNTLLTLYNYDLKYLKKNIFLNLKSFVVLEISEDAAVSPSSKSVTNEASSATTTTTTLWARPSGRGTSRSAATTSAAAAGGAGGPPGYHRRGSLQVLTLATIFCILPCLSLELLQR